MRKIYEKPCLEVESVEIDGMIAISAQITSDGSGSDPVVITNNGNSSDPDDGSGAVTSADTKAWGRGVYWE